MLKDKTKTSLAEMAQQLASGIARLKTISDASLEEITKEVEQTSDCIVVEKSEVLDAAKHIALRSGKVGYYWLAVCDRMIGLEVSMRRFVQTSISEAEEENRLERFVADARRLAKLLNAAALRAEQIVKDSPPDIEAELAQPPS